MDVRAARAVANPRSSVPTGGSRSEIARGGRRPRSVVKGGHGGAGHRVARQLAVALLAAGLLTGCSSTAPARKGPAPASLKSLWIAPRNVVADLSRGSGLRSQLDRLNLVEIVRPGQRIYPGIRAVGAVSLKSLASIRDFLQSPVEASGIGAVIYDNENWPLTPAQEALKPIQTQTEASRMVRGHHLTYISTPGLDLVALLPARPGQSRWRRYLDTGWSGATARVSDVFEIQAQAYEADPPVYAKFVLAAAKQARAANPRVILVAGLTSTRGFSTALTAAILRCVRLTARSLNGYFLNVPQPSLAKQVLAAASRQRA